MSVRWLTGSLAARWIGGVCFWLLWVALLPGVPKLKVTTDKGRFRWQCPESASCHFSRKSVLCDSAWFSEHGATNSRRVAIIVVGRGEGMSLKDIALLAGVKQETVTVILDRASAATAEIDAAGHEEGEEGSQNEMKEGGDTEVSDTSLTSCDEELSDFESVGTPSGAAVHFERSRYRVHDEYVPEDYQEAANVFMAAHRFRDKRLFLSCLYFLTLLLAHQPKAFTDYTSASGSVAQRNLLDKMGHVPDVHHHVVQQGFSQGLLPAYDAKERGRSMRALQFHVALYGAAAAMSKATLTAWYP